MTFTATAVQVMIASPSDVSAERGVLRSVIADWNDLHTVRTGLVALPLAWESHSVPQMGARPQAILNERGKAPPLGVLRRCRTTLKGCDRLLPRIRRGPTGRSAGS